MTEPKAETTATLPTGEAATEQLANVLVANNITVTADFVPRSKSKSPKAELVNWTVTVLKSGVPVLTIPFAQSIAHLAGLSLTVHGGRQKTYTAEDLAEALETGKGGRLRAKAPSATDVMFCLGLDYGVMEQPDFEQWADVNKQDKDSRKAQGIYEDSLKSALKLKATLGDNCMLTIRKIAQRM